MEKPSEGFCIYEMEILMYFYLGIEYVVNIILLKSVQWLFANKRKKNLILKIYQFITGSSSVHRHS